jgi:HEAT repeat protein
VPILPSAGKRIKEWLRRLESPVPAERESAVARLTLLGPRTLPHLEEFLGEAHAAGRLAALDLIERLGEARALPAVLGLTTSDDDQVARRALEVAAGFPEPQTARALRAVLAGAPSTRRAAAAQALGQLHRLGLVDAVEPLLDLVLDAEEDEAIRLGALEALSSLDARALRPALLALGKDKSPVLVRAAALLGGRRSAGKIAEPSSSAEADVSTLLARLTSPRTSPAEVETVVAALVERRSPALLALLGRRLTEIGGGAPTRATAQAKARIHLALAALGSRIALHDLRELLKARPVHAALDLLTAAGRAGDASLVPALAALAADEPLLAEAAAPALRAIVEREKLRRTSRVIANLRPEHQAALNALWAPPQRGSSTGASRARKRRLR